jgi:hypothetical protein
VWSSLSGSKVQVSATSSITLSSTESSGFCRYTAGGQGTVTFSFYPNKTGFFCVDIDQSKRNSFTVRKNGAFLYNDSYSLPQMISVSDVVPGDRIDIAFTCKAGESGTISLKNGILNEELFRKAHGILNASTLELSEFSTTYVAGTINCNREGLLYTSIPQNGNWYATVDGKAVETVKVGNAMLGIPMSEGQHTVTLTYRNDAFRAGLCATLLSTAVFAVLWIIFYKPFEKFRKAK